MVMLEGGMPIVGADMNCENRSSLVIGKVVDWTFKVMMLSYQYVPTQVSTLMNLVWITFPIRLPKRR